MAREFKPSTLEEEDHFIISPIYPFILRKPIECKQSKINASKENPLFGCGLHFNIDRGREDEESKVKSKITMIEFKRQPFCKSVILCKQHNIDNKWKYSLEDGTIGLKGAQYFVGFTTMVKYCYHQNLIDIAGLSDKEEKMIDLELRSTELFTEESLRRIQED